MVRVQARAGVAERLSQMIQIPTVSAEYDTRGSEPVDAFIALLEELYPLTHEHLSRERITDLGLLFHWRGADPHADPVVLMAHFDVVPVDENDDWTHPPFAGTVADGWVYGRGTLDDKGPLIVVLEAVENLLAAGFSPARDVYLSFGGNEETFGDAARTIAETLQHRGVTPWLVLDEGGAVVDSPFPGVPGVSAMIGVGEKGIATVRLSAHTEGGHASTPPKLTAVARVARAVARLRRFPARTPTAVTDMLRAFATRAHGVPGAALGVLAASPRLTASAFTLVGTETSAMVRTTVAPTMLRGGTASNVLPSQASAILNLRIGIGDTVTAAIRRVRRQVRDPLVCVELVEGNAPSPEAPSDNAQFRLLTEALAASHPAAAPVPYIMTGATDSRYFHQFCRSTYRFAPLAMNADQRASIHGVDERVEIAELERGELFHRTLLQRVA